MYNLAGNLQERKNMQECKINDANHMALRL